MGIELTKKKQSIELVAASGGEEVTKAYEKGYNEATKKADNENPFYYAKTMNFTFSSRAFAPERSNIVCRVLDCKEWNMAFGQLSGIKTLKIICDTPDLTVGFAQLVRQSADLELLDLSEFKCYPNSLAYFIYDANKLKTIVGALDLTKCTVATSAFAANSLENIEFVPNTISVALGFQHCKNLTHKSLLSILNGLKDFSGTTTTLTLTLHANSKAKLSEDEKQIATKKGWTIA